MGFASRRRGFRRSIYSDRDGNTDIDAEMVRAFLSSAEYRQRFGR